MQKLIPHLLSLLLLLMLGSFSGYAQHTVYKHYTPKNGLPSSEVHQILQDKKGYMWFATDRGISKFDGFTFKNFTTNEGLSNNTIFYIKQDHKERIWYSSIKNELGYILNDTAYVHPLNDTLRKLNFFNFIQNLYVDINDTIWIGLKEVEPNNDIYGLKITPDNQLEFLRIPNYDSTQSCTYIKNIENNDLITSITYGTDRSPTNKTRIIIEEPQRILLDSLITSPFLGANAHKTSEGKYIFEKETRLFQYDHQKLTYQDFPSRIIGNRFKVENNGDVWVSFLYNGIWKVPQDYKNINDHTKATQLLKKQNVSCIFQDRENGHWITTLSDGIYYYPEIGVQSLFPNNSFPGIVNCIEEFNDTAWIGFSNGSLVKTFKQENKYQHRTIVKTKGSIFHLKKYENHPLVLGFTSTNRLPQYISGPLKTSLMDSKGTLYVFSGNTVARKLKNENRFHFYMKIKSMHPRCGYIDDKDVIWLGNHRGLYKLDGDFFTPMGNKFKILGKRINAIDQLGDQLVLASLEDGVLLFDGKKITKITTKDGLSSNQVNTVKVVSDSLIYAGTSMGLDRIVIRNGKYYIQSYNESNGLTSRKINAIDIGKERVWIGTDNGISHFDKTLRLTNETPPIIHINSLTVNSQKHTPDSILTFDYKANSFLFDFIALSYKSPENNIYQYRIKELDTNWVSTKSRNIQLSILSHGMYTFELRGSNNNGVWSKATKMKIKITPPFWKTWWFITFFILVVTGISIRLLQLKIKRVEKEANLLNEKLKAENEKQLAQEQLEKEQLENELTKKEIDFKKREMVSYSIQLNKKNDLLISMKNEIDSLKNRVDSRALSGMKKIIHSNLNFDNDWETFKMHFNSVHPDFFESLSSTYPALSSGELRYCTYFKLQMSNKEIAQLLNVTPKAVHIAKYRIKKKLELTKEDDLMEFLKRWE